MKRVLVFGAGGDRLGGIETFLFNMSKKMEDEHFFDYVIIGSKCISKEDIMSLGGRVYHVRYFKENLIGAFVDIYSLLKQHRNEYSTAYFNLYSMAHIWQVFLAKLMGYRVVLHAHNSEMVGGKVKRAVHVANRFFFSNMRCIRMTNSELSTSFMFGKKHLTDTALIHNAIDVTRFAFDRNARERVRVKCHLCDNHVYGFSGRIADEKNPLFLLDVFREISFIDKKAAFIVCGSGDLESEMQRRANDNKLNIIFTGNVKNIENYYQAMDCFILPSRFEGLGNVLIEAQCAGLPCITSEGVVPIAAKATDLLEYIPLKDNPHEWAEKSVNKVSIGDNDRSKYSRIIAASDYNIDNESKRLEGILFELPNSDSRQAF